jgi:uncharacterized protein YbgA (DUF1722 family)
MSNVVTVLMEEGYESMHDPLKRTGYDLAHSTMLVHLGSYFFDSIHSEERTAFSEKNSFMRFFYKF